MTLLVVRMMLLRMVGLPCAPCADVREKEKRPLLPWWLPWGRTDEDRPILCLTLKVYLPRLGRATGFRVRTETTVSLHYRQGRVTPDKTLTRQIGSRVGEKIFGWVKEDSKVVATK